MPQPAPARMSSGPSVVWTARACSGLSRPTISSARADGRAAPGGVGGRLALATLLGRQLDRRLGCGRRLAQPLGLGRRGVRECLRRVVEERPLAARRCVEQAAGAGPASRGGHSVIVGRPASRRLHEGVGRAVATCPRGTHRTTAGRRVAARMARRTRQTAVWTSDRPSDGASDARPSRRKPHPGAFPAVQPSSGAPDAHTTPGRTPSAVAVSPRPTSDARAALFDDPSPPKGRTPVACLPGRDNRRSNRCLTLRGPCPSVTCCGSGNNSGWMARP